MAMHEEHVTTQMAALDRQLLLEMTVAGRIETPTVRIPIVCEEVADAPRAPARSVAEMRVKRALEWWAWGALMVAPAFTLSC
jgi:hypothetical protein